MVSLAPCQTISYDYMRSKKPVSVTNISPKYPMGLFFPPSTVSNDREGWLGCFEGVSWKTKLVLYVSQFYQLLMVSIL